MVTVCDWDYPDAPKWAGGMAREGGVYGGGGKEMSEGDFLPHMKFVLRMLLSK